MGSWRRSGNKAPRQARRPPQAHAAVLAAGRQPSIDDPTDIRDYYIRLYHSGRLDEHDIQRGYLVATLGQ